MNIENILTRINSFVWGPVMLILLVGTGVFLTIRLKFLPWRNLGYAIKEIFKKEDKSKDTDKGDISPIQSLMTALAATIGTGNIVGVATAMVLGGPGALVWMWISALFGLSTKYGESVLAIKYRETNSVGEMSGGPMYAMKNGIKTKWLGKILAIMFSLFAVLASFGIGNMTQANSISTALYDSYAIPKWIVGLIIMILAITVLLGGIKSIGKVCGVVVPFMAVIYFLATALVILFNIKNLPSGISEMFTMAFSVKSLAGGVGGTITASILSSMRWGVARGVFSNEAGLGSAPIVAAAAKTDCPSRQGYVNMTGTFFDTIIICTVTGLAIAASGVLGSVDANGEVVTGVNLTINAFSTLFGQYGKTVVSIGITLFAFSTILGWEYYGEKSLEFLIRKESAVKIYRIIFSLVTFIGATTSLQMVWDFSDTMNGLMAIPNLICLILLHNNIAEECFDFQEKVVIPSRK